MNFIKLGHRVIRAEWSAAESQWHIAAEVVETGEVVYDRCDVLLSATGVLKCVANKPPPCSSRHFRRC